MNFEIINPKSTIALLDTLNELRDSNYRFAAGCTDLLMELRKHPDDELILINLSGVEDEQLQGFAKVDDGYRMGAMFTANKIIINEEIKKHFPVLHEAASNLASRQIRQVATVGGNLCTASPSGDIACALVALQASCEILNSKGEKRLVSINDFFLGPRKTVIQKDELLFGILIPNQENTTASIHSGFIKIGTRRSMECSVVSLAYHIQLDGNSIIQKSGIGIGAAAPTIKFPESACGGLKGKSIKNIPAIMQEEFAGQILSYASPISDLRASAWYRKQVLFNISKSIFQ